MTKTARLVPYFLSGSLAAATVPAAYMVLTRVQADLVYRENTSEALEQAARLTPENAAVHMALADQVELAGGDPEPELRAAAQVDPLLGDAWMRLGLLAASRGDARAAEQLLLRGARVSRLLPPREALMRFYVQQGNATEFWRWARLALERSYGDRGPLFDLCWRMAGEPEEVYERAVPRDSVLIRSYVSYLLARDRPMAAVRPACDLLKSGASTADRDLALNLCERLIGVSAADAIRVWNAACSGGVFPYEPLAPEVRATFVDGGFRYDPMQRGFAWKSVEHGDIAVNRLPAGGLELAFDGREPEGIDLLQQVLALAPNRRYRIGLEYQTEDMAALPGLLLSVAVGHTLLGETGLAAAGQLVTGEVVFTAPRDGLTTLRLRYQRPLGEPRTEGRLTVRRANLQEIR